MAGDDNGTEQEGRSEDSQLRIRIRKRDELIPSPEVRAKFVLDLIQNHNPNVTNWDLLCFCSEYLGSQVLLYEWLEKEYVITIAKRVQLAHYLADELPESGVV